MIGPPINSNLSCGGPLRFLDLLPRCRRGGQRDRERITAEHHQSDKLPDSALCVGLGTDQFRDVADPSVSA